MQGHQELLRLRPPDRGSWGSTAVLTLWQTGSSFVRVASVGNSRAYLLRGCSTDSPGCPVGRPRGRAGPQVGVAVRRCWRLLGGFESALPVQMQSVPLQPNDRWLLCSDGIASVVPEDNLGGLLGEQTCPGSAAVALCRLALERGSHDNVSCILADYRVAAPTQRRRLAALEPGAGCQDRPGDRPGTALPGPARPG